MPGRQRPANGRPGVQARRPPATDLSRTGLSVADPARADPFADRELTPALAALLVVGGVVVTAAGAAFGVVTAVLALVAVAYGISMVRSPLFTVLVLVALVPALAGLARGLPVPGLKIAEILIVIGAVVVLVLGQKATVARFGAVDYLALGYVVVNAALVTGNAATGESGATPSEVVAMVGSPLLFFLLYRTVTTVIRTPSARTTALRILLWASLPVSVLALLQRLVPAVHDALVFATDTGVFDTPGYEPVMRVTSVFPIWHSLAAYLLVVLVLAAALLLDPDQRVLSRGSLGVIAVAGSVAMVLTLTIATILGVVLGVALVGVAYGQLRRVIVALGVSALVAVALFRPLIEERIAGQVVTTSAGRTSLLPETMATRLEVWTEQYLPVLAGHLLRGYGQDSPPGILWTHTESQYLTFLLRGGVPLLLVFLALLFVVHSSAGRRQDDPERRPLARAVRSLVVVTCVICYIFPYFTNNGLPHITWVLWGLLFAPPLPAVGGPKPTVSGGLSDPAPSPGTPLGAGRAAAGRGGGSHDV